VSVSDERSSSPEPRAVIDSHCHLAGREFSADLADVVQRASANDVQGVLCILSEGDADEDRAAERLRTLWPAARFATGIHPHNAGAHAGRLEQAMDAVERRVREHHAVAIGEIGLDYHYDFSPRDVQREVFRAQISLAKRLSLPVIIHTREATDDTLRVLAEDGAGDLRGVFHCFTGDVVTAQAALRLGFYLSFAGIVTFPKAESVREAARMAPADRLLVETDAPYLAPIPHRGTRNEPAYIARIVERLAEVRGTSAGDLAAATTANFATLFDTHVS
jgi:TatD DNase family protein